jgi:signal recognition particle receptor subunit beta
VVPHTVETALPAGRAPSSQRHRSANDVETKAPKKLLLTDTPGHGKLRHFAFNSLDEQGGKGKRRTTGIIFVVDAANLSNEEVGASSGLREAAGYLHDVLLHLQKQVAAGKLPKGRRHIPVLIAANKMDLFTSLPANMVRASLEAEITRQRSTRARGIAGVGSAGIGEGLDTGADPDAGHDENDALAGESQGKFEFARMADWGIGVTVVGGSAAGEEASVDKWWDWVAEHV